MKLPVTKTQFINIMSFLSIFCINSVLIKASPDYILEKYSRFIGLPEDVKNWDNPGAIHPVLMEGFIHKYIELWKPVFKED